MTGQRAGSLVTKHQTDTTNCLNAFSLICNWPHLWLSSLALSAVLNSAVGSPLGVHPAASMQAPISVTVPAGAVVLPVMPYSNKICLISSVKHPRNHFFPLSFTFFIFFFVFSYSYQLLWSVTKRHFVVLIQDCWYLPPYAMLTLVSRNSLKMQLCVQTGCACKPPWLLPSDPNPNWLLLWPPGHRAALVSPYCPTTCLPVWDL